MVRRIWTDFLLQIIRTDKVRDAKGERYERNTCCNSHTCTASPASNPTTPMNTSKILQNVSIQTNKLRQSVPSVKTAKINLVGYLLPKQAAPPDSSADKVKSWSRNWPNCIISGVSSGSEDEATSSLIKYLVTLKGEGSWGAFVCLGKPTGSFNPFAS